MGIQLVIYVDDILIYHKVLSILESQINFLLEDGKAAGITWNMEKSVLTPTRVIEHQGVILDTRSNTFRLPQRRFEKIVSLAKTLLLSPKCLVSLHSLQVFTGTVKSAQIAIGPWTNIFLRSLWDLMKGDPPADAWIYLSDQALLDLRFWANLKEPSQPFIKPCPTSTICSDATLSGFSWGGVQIPGLW